MTEAIADPERMLALAYAPAGRRGALALLWRLDERLGAVLALAHDPMIRAIRLAWWREALERLDHGAAPDEPLLREIAAGLLPLGISGAELAAIEEGWAALADPAAGAEALALHGAARGGALFTIAAKLLGGRGDPAMEAAGEGWALIDALPLIEAGARETARAMARARLASVAGKRWPRALRPLGILAVLAARDARAPAGRVRRPGSPGRVWRALLMGMAGR